MSEESSRLKQCWAFADSNYDVTGPCLWFRSNAIHLVQASSPKIDRWKEWIKQMGGQVVIMDLPTIKEIAAVAQEKGYEASQSAVYAKKWGPSIRTNLEILLADSRRVLADKELELTDTATNAAGDICAAPSRLRRIDLSPGKGTLDLLHSHLIFVCRRRTQLPTGIISWKQWAPTIPTDHLVNIFEQARVALSNQVSLDLFKFLSRHALMRSAAGWNHEMRMHTRICTTDSTLEIFRGADDVRRIHTSSSGNLLPCSLSGLTAVGVSTAFYWMPQVANFKGTDSVLGTADGEIYALQATIANDHNSPIAGLTKLWKKLRSDVRSRRNWNVVFVADTQGAAAHLLELYSEDIKLGKDRVPVVFWGCRLDPIE